jgi:hypothetical protein
MKRIVFLFLALGHLGCEHFLARPFEIDELTDGEDVVVVNAFLTDVDTVMRVKLDWGHPTVGKYSDREEDRYFNDAEVYVEHQGIPYHFRKQHEYGDFLLPSDQLPLISGDTYKLFVIVDDQKDTIKSKLVYPANIVKPGSFEVSYRKGSIDPEVGQAYRPYFSWEQNSVVEQAFYQIYYANFDSVTPTGQVVGISSENMLDWKSFVDQEVSRISIPKSNDEFYPGRYRRAFFLLQTITPDTYQFFETYHIHQQTRTNPFAEPFNVHTNIEGGLGIFGALNLQAYLPIRSIE